jgi:hypothetical protein
MAEFTRTLLTAKKNFVTLTTDGQSQDESDVFLFVVRDSRFADVASIRGWIQ